MEPEMVKEIRRVISLFSKRKAVVLIRPAESYHQLKKELEGLGDHLNVDIEYFTYMKINN